MLRSNSSALALLLFCRALLGTDWRLSDRGRRGGPTTDLILAFYIKRHHERFLGERRRNALELDLCAGIRFPSHRSLQLQSSLGGTILFLDRNQDLLRTERRLGRNNPRLELAGRCALERAFEVGVA